jgi:hypothetical protein
MNSWENERTEKHDGDDDENTEWHFVIPHKKKTSTKNERTMKGNPIFPFCRREPPSEGEKEMRRKWILTD